jgi:hypothetical protein
MKFTITNNKTGHTFKGGRYYIDNTGRLFADRDPSGVDMSGRRRIVELDRELYTVNFEYDSFFSNSISEITTSEIKG